MNGRKLIQAQGAAEMAVPTPSPSQQQAIDHVLRASSASRLVLLTGEVGTGRTFVLETLQRQCGGKILNAADLMALTGSRHARRYEQSLYDLIRSTFAEHDILYLDDASGFQRADRVPGYNRIGQMSAVLRIARDIAVAEDKRIVLATDYLPSGDLPGPMANWDDKGVVIKIAALDEGDYRHILISHLGEDALQSLDVAQLFAGSRRLTAKSLTHLARVLIEKGVVRPTVADALAIVDRDILHGNVDLEEVDSVSMDTLVGVEEIAARIDRAILLPLTEPELARELGLVPKHGILLYGPPGTGKTTIGRALAHKMKGKFFIIDGDFVHDGPGFQSMVDAVFEAAVRSSPSVIFIDDADVILNDPDMQHFGRYLLTKLDGLKSESLANVCVMMTAMNIASMPPALLRSGRLEVWLKTTPPGPDGRAALLRSYIQRLTFPEAEAAVDHSDTLAQVTDGFTPADIRRLVGDAAGRLAFDRHSQRPEQNFADYLDLSVADLSRQKAFAEQAIHTRGGMRFH